MAATHLGLVIESRNGQPRQANWIAATGKTFDYRIKLAAYDAGGAVDTSYNGSVTATVTTGTCTLGGTVTRNCASGVVDFSDLLPATGTGTLAITFASGGLASYVTPAMTVVAPTYDAYSLARHGVQVELPRLQVDSTLPTVFARTLNVGPSRSVVAGVSYHTIQAALDYCTANDIVGNTKIVLDVATYAEALMLRTRSAGKGIILLTPAVVPLAPGVRATPATLATVTALMPQVSIEAPGGLVRCENDSYGYIGVGLDFAVPVPALGTATEISAALYIAVASPTSMSSFPHHVGFDRCVFRAIDPVNTRLTKTLTQECAYFFLESCYVADAHDYPSGVNNGNGNGDTNAWNTTSFAGGPAKVNNTFFSGAGEVVLIGGSDPQFYDARYRDVTFTHNVLYKDPAWMGVRPAKNNYEHKSSARWLTEGCIFDGSWEAGQDGSGIVAGSANQGGTPATDFEGIRDFTFRRNFSRNMTHWAVFSGINYINAEIMNGVAVYDNLAVNIHQAGFGDDSSHILAMGNGINRFVFEQNTVLSPESRNTTALNVVSPTPNPNAWFRRNILSCGSLGLYVQGASGGTAGMAIAFPDDDIRENVLIAKAGSAAFGGADHPPLSYYPATYAAVGFVDLPGAVAIWDVGDPDLICAKLTLAGGSAYRGITSDATDPGANMAALRAAISGVWGGNAAGSTATQLALTTQPSAAISGQPLPTQPAGSVQDPDGGVTMLDASTVTATLIVTSGIAQAIGGRTAVVSAGLWAFTTLGAISNAGATAFWRFTDGALTSVDSDPFVVIPRLRGRRLLH